LCQIIKELAEFISALSTCHENTEDLVGKRIAHKFEVEDSCERWYNGTIVGFNSTSKLYEISYDSEEENCYFDLEQDFMMGDIIIL